MTKTAVRSATCGTSTAHRMGKFRRLSCKCGGRASKESLLQDETPNKCAHDATYHQILPDRKLSLWRCFCPMSTRKQTPSNGSVRRPFKYSTARRPKSHQGEGLLPQAAQVESKCLATVGDVLVRIALPHAILFKQCCLLSDL